MRIAGEEGAFAGYERVEFLFESELESDGLCLVGWLVPRPSPNFHRVRYSAYTLLPRQRAGERDRDLLIAHAVGTTVLPTRCKGGTDNGVST